MVRKQRKRISYVLPLANDAGGHRLGVNGLAVDPLNSILYSGGRDGVICAWSLGLDLTPFSDPAAVPPTNGNSDANGTPKPPPTLFRQQVQAHTHWINDIVLAQNNQALVSASSDITVKVWRPYAQDGGASRPQTIGLHEDYVKTLASPGAGADWVASGGLDRKIYLWDLNGAGQKLRINVGEEENTAKGSVYALACTPTLVAGGGPESIVRVWDPRSGRRITKFVGHTDNIRDVLISQDGDMVITASSDQTVKVWSMTAGRCMNTLTMHNDSVWSLCSDHPRLSVFYSGDRSGLIAKTDTRGCEEIDDGVSVAVCQEHEGINKVIQAGDHIWTATSSSSINRWNDVDTEAEVQVLETYSTHRASIVTTKSRIPSPPTAPTTNGNGTGPFQLPFQSLLRLSNAAPFYLRRGDSISVAPSIRKPSEVLPPPEPTVTVPVRTLPEHTIEGQHGLIKHMTLNDRKRVLTIDTNSEVVLWDLLQCCPVKSFGKRDMDDVFREINTMDAVAHWCAVDTRTGSLTCSLEENTAFDAEAYADELPEYRHIDFREDQRINLGKWVLRYLFDNLIDEEIKRDETFRQRLLVDRGEGVNRPGAPGKIKLPQLLMTSWYDNASAPQSLETPRATNGHLTAQTPGLAIGLATPLGLPTLQTHSGGAVSAVPSLPTTVEETEGQGLSKVSTQQGALSPNAAEKSGQDYFSQQPNANSAPGATPGAKSNDGLAADAAADVPATSPNADPTTPGEKTSMFGKKMWKSLGMKGLKKTTTNEASKPAAVVEESSSKSEDSGSRSSKAGEEAGEVVIEDNFSGLIQRMHLDYEAQVQAYEKREAEATAGGERPPLRLESHITPSLPADTPVIKLPPNTVLLIQEDRIDSGGVADLFEGTVGSLASSADLIEKAAPTWLADVLLKNTIPLKDIVKVSFVLEPWQGVLPAIASDGNTRLNANRMLRARKILGYVAERIDPGMVGLAEDDPARVRPEEYLELWCQDKLIPPTMTLATIRAHVWRGGGDVMLHYKANGRRNIPNNKFVHGLTPPVKPREQQNVPSMPPLPAAAQAQAGASAHKHTPSAGGSSHRSHRSAGSNEYIPPRGAGATVGRYSEDARRPPTSGSTGVKRPEGNWI